MSHYLIKDSDGSRHISRHHFPLAIGGTDADIPLPISHQEPLAWIGLAEDGVFLQPTDGEKVICNGATLVSSHWLQAGDILELGKAHLHIEREDNVICFHLKQASGKEIPALTPPPKREHPISAATTGKEQGLIKPLAFKPNPIVANRSGGSVFRPATVLASLLLLTLGVVATFLFLSKSVAVVVSPTPDHLQVKTLIAPKFGERYLMLSGSYEVVAEKQGYRTFHTTLEVNGDSRQDFHFDMEKMPGLLKIEGPDGAQVTINDQAVGVLPSEPFELDAGEHQIKLQAPRHQDFNTTVAMEGMGRTQELKVELIPRWAPVTFLSQPQGADVFVGSLKVGSTPVTGDIGAGDHSFELRMKGFKTHRGQIQVEANEPQKLATIPLIPADGTLELTSEPPGAMVTVNGIYRGVTPLSATLPPNKPHAFRFYKAGYEAQGGEVTLQPGTRDVMHGVLPGLKGELVVSAWPSGSELSINKVVRDLTDGSFTLASVPQKIVIQKPGFRPFQTSITPMPGFAKSLDVQLKTIEQAKVESTPTLLKASGHALQLIKPGRFHMGASRREPGRRANETYKEVELTRAFYLGVHEVSNSQFKRFMTQHSSGSFQSHTLEGDDQPVVNITWKQAAAYCNWLSEKEGLTPFYQEQGGSFVPVKPKNTGYRLPSEAEWTWAARYVGGKEASRKYPWGAKMPMPPDSGNYADVSAGEFLPGVLKSYQDGRPVTGPVESFLPNPLGIFNLGGNVAEWVHDYYNISPTGVGKVSRDPFGDDTGKFRVIRGSSWQHSTITELRLSFRDYGDKPRPDVGFRLARYVE